MSILLEKDKNLDQNIILTLSETLTNPSSGQTYYFIFRNEQNNITYTKELTDISSYYERYNKFSINTEIGGSQVNNIPFLYEGWYEYKCYINSGSTDILELGKCYIFDDNTPSGTTTYTSTNNIYVYDE